MLNLTYDDEHLPEHGQLWKEDLQRFFKRLRKAGFKFKYVASGEYGDVSRRPHFHIALFGVDFHHDRIPFGRSGNDRTYTSSSVSSVWPHGNHLIGALNFESAAYIARYILKKLKGPNVSPVPLYSDSDSGEIVLPNSEFMLMSKGIGRSWFREYFLLDVFPTGSVITAQGSKAPVPRFYKTLLKEVGSDLALEMQHKSTVRLEMSREHHAYENLSVRKSARALVNDSRTKLSKRIL
jgi:hypothetical protein